MRKIKIDWELVVIMFPAIFWLTLLIALIILLCVSGKDIIYLIYWS